MKNIIEISSNIIKDMKDILTEDQLKELSSSLSRNLGTCMVLDPTKTCDTLGKSYLVLDKFLDAKATYKASPKTIKAYRGHLFNFINYIEQPLSLVTEEHIRLYLQYKSLSISPVSVENIRHCLSSFFGWLYDFKYIPMNPCTKNLVPPIKQPETIRHDITAKDVVNIKDAAVKIENKLARLRALALIDFLESTGCRVNEIANLEMKDLDLDNCKAKILGKGNKERFVFLSVSCKKRLEEYLEYKKTIQKDSVYVFSNLRTAKLNKPMNHHMLEKITKELGEQCGIPDLTIHIFRRYFATNGNRKGLKPDTLRTLMGHSSYQTTLRYIALSQEDLYSQFNKIY